MTPQQAIEEIMGLFPDNSSVRNLLEPEIAIIIYGVYDEGHVDGYNCACSDFKLTLDKAKELIYKEMKL